MDRDAQTAKKKRLVKVDEIMATYDKYLPFNNIKLNDDYLLIDGSKVAPQLAVEPVYNHFDLGRMSVPSRTMESQLSRGRHPNDHNSIYIPETQQLVMYDSYKQYRSRGWGELGRAMADMKFLSQDNLRLDDGDGDDRSKHTLINEKHLGGVRMSYSATKSQKRTRQESATVYCPNFEVGMTRLAVGVTALDKQVSRETMPPGRVAEVPNLITTQTLNGDSIDPVRVHSAFKQQGHVRNREGFDFSKARGRDNRFYM